MAKSQHHHLDSFCSCADTEHQSGNCDQKYQPGKQVEYDGRKLRKEDTDPLYQGIGVHFSQTSKDTLDDKMKRLMRDDVKTDNF